MIGLRLRQLRKERDMTQKELGVMIGVTDAAISAYEQDKRTPDPPELLKLAEVFNVTTDYLLGRTDNRKTMIFYQDQVCESPARYLIPDDDRRVQEIIQELHRITDDPEILENILQYAKFLVHQERLNPAKDKKSPDKQKDTK